MTMPNAHAGDVAISQHIFGEKAHHKELRSSLGVLASLLHLFITVRLQGAAPLRPRPAAQTAAQNTK